MTLDYSAQLLYLSDWDNNDWLPHKRSLQVHLRAIVPAECYRVVGFIEDLMELFLCFPFARVDEASPQVSWQNFQLAFCCCDERGHVSPRKCVLSKKEESAGKGLLFCKISFC